MAARRKAGNKFAGPLKKALSVRDVVHFLLHKGVHKDDVHEHITKLTRGVKALRDAKNVEAQVKHSLTDMGASIDAGAISAPAFLTSRVAVKKTKRVAKKSAKRKTRR